MNIRAIDSWLRSLAVAIGVPVEVILESEVGELVERLKAKTRC